MVDPEGAVLKKDLAGADPQGIDSKSVAEKKSPGQTIDTHHEGRCNPLWKITEIMQDDQEGKKGQRDAARTQTSVASERMCLKASTRSDIQSCKGYDQHQKDDDPHGRRTRIK